MYQPPCARQNQPISHAANAANAAHATANTTYVNRPVIKDSGPRILSLSEYKKQQSIKKPVKTISGATSTTIHLQSTKNIESKECSTEKPTEFWNDIYNFSSDKEALYWNHSLAKETMIKLLQEQGTIKFNPIQYYRNTVESQDSLVKKSIERIHMRIVQHFIKFLEPLNSHNITTDTIGEMIKIAKKTISESSVAESTKLSLIETYTASLTEYSVSKSPELAQKYCIKYKQQLKFLESMQEQLEDKKAMSSYYKLLVTDKAEKLIVETVLKGKPFLFKELAHVDKTVKKDFKFLSSLPFDSKYFIRQFQYALIHSYLENEHSKLKKQIDATTDEKKKKSGNKNLSKLGKKIDEYVELMESLENIMHVKLYPFIDSQNLEKVVTIEKELDLYEYSNTKDKIISEQNVGSMELQKKADLAIISSIESIDFDKPSILEIANCISSINTTSIKVLAAVKLFICFTKNMVDAGTFVNPQMLKVYIETYTYIINYIDDKDIVKEFNKLDVDVQEKYEEAHGRIQKYFKKNNIDIYEYQMTHLYEYLSPLSHFDEKKPRLDQWQKDVFEMMDNRKNVIVIAPTSSGKTALSTYCSLIANRVLFVVPSPELARQVCGMIRNLVHSNNLKKHISLITEKDTYHDSMDSFDILVGTPGALESYFVENNIEPNIFDYIVFDEIHQLNQNIVGSELERWIKWLTYKTTSKFLALSACVGNATQLHTWWGQFVENIELVVCNRRFLQQQKFLWNGELTKVHPLTVCSLEFLQGNGFMDGDVVKSDMSFTPDELYNLYTQIKNHKSFPNSLQPLNYFKTCRLTLELCKEWEWSLKKTVQDLAKEDPEFVESVLNSYKLGLSKKIEESNVEDLYKLLKQLQGRNMLPAILFRLDPGICQQKFSELVYYLKDEETRVYPTYYDDLGFSNSAYEEYVRKDKDLETLNISDETIRASGMTAESYIEKRKADLKNTHIALYQKKFSELMNSHIAYSMDKYEALKDNKELDETVKSVMQNNYKRQIQYYESEIVRVRSISELCPVNIYRPHQDFTFLDEYIDSNHIIEYRKQLMNYMREEKEAQYKFTVNKKGSNAEEAEQKDAKDAIRREAYVSYDHPFMIGMERGVILYLNRLPTPFQRVAQSLIASHMRLAPITFSDQSLAFGVNYPIRTVILTGGYINPIVAHQMIGRAGRRGIDPKGYTVYYGVDWETIIKEKYLEVNGSTSIDGTIWPMPYLWTNLEDKFDLVSKYHLKDYVDSNKMLEDRYDTFIGDIQKLFQTFGDGYNNELLEEGAFEQMVLDVYKNKHIGIQSMMLPLLLEELTRWKYSAKNLKGYEKWSIVQILTAFLNCNFTHPEFSEATRSKFAVWNKNIGGIIQKYKKDVDYTPLRLEDKITEQEVEYWFNISSLLSTLYSISKDCRGNHMKTLFSTLFYEIKTRLKRVAF
jgi:hypothetical protein